MTEQTEKGRVHRIDDAPDFEPHPVDARGMPVPRVLPFIAVDVRGNLVLPGRMPKARTCRK